MLISFHFLISAAYSVQGRAMGLEDRHAERVQLAPAGRLRTIGQYVLHEYRSVVQVVVASRPSRL